jgi:hypothetical protein
MPFISEPFIFSDPVSKSQYYILFYMGVEFSVNRRTGCCEVYLDVGDRMYQERMQSFISVVFATHYCGYQIEEETGGTLSREKDGRFIRPPGGKTLDE